MYGRTDRAKEDMEYINAAHVFSDILGMAHDHYREVHTDDLTSSLNTTISRSAEDVAPY